MSSSDSSSAGRQRKRKQQDEHFARTATPLVASKLIFSLEAIVRECHKPAQRPPDPASAIIYCVAFCDIAEAYNSYFATARSNCLSLYQVVRSSNKGKEEDATQLCKCFIDEDKAEVYYTACFGITDGNKPCIFAAGEKGVIKGHCCVDNSIKVVLGGHGNSINDLRTHPVDRNLLLSASKDQSVRLWNVLSHVCIAIFAGLNAHKDEVLCADFHPSGNVFVSSGQVTYPIMSLNHSSSSQLTTLRTAQDTSIRIWSLESPQIKNVISKSYSDPTRSGGGNFLTWMQQSPVYTCRCHGRDYIDTARFVGNLILSKSTKNRIVLWCPDSRDKGSYTVLREFDISDQDLFFVRLATCPRLGIFAFGNRHGKVSIYQMFEAQCSKKPTIVSRCEGFPVGDKRGSSTKKALKQGTVLERYQDDVHHEQVGLVSLKKKNVRAVAFSADAAHVVYTLDDGSIHLWRIEAARAEPEPASAT